MDWTVQCTVVCSVRKLSAFSSSFKQFGAIVQYVQ